MVHDGDDFDVRGGTVGLLNKRTLNKAKALAEKNKEKIASGVNKATDAIDKKTGGKHTDKLRKLDDAAAKFAGHGDETAEGGVGTAPSGSDATSEERGPSES